MNVRDEQFAMGDTRPITATRSKPVTQDRDTVSALRAVAAFRGLPVPMLTRLAAAATRLDLARGELLFSANTHAAGLYIVASGRVMLSVGTLDAGQKVVRLAEAGDLLGLTATLLGNTTLSTAEALVESSVLMLPRDALLERAQRDAQLALALANAAALQSRQISTDLESVSLQSGRERIVNYLLACATGGAPNSLTVTLPAKKSIIASRLSVTPEYFSRTLHELISAAAIEVNGRQIIIRDAARLRGVHSRHG
jgi:CRP-like cAMP-binding protein